MDAATRAALLGLLWWVLVEGEGGGWLLATAILGSALLASFRIVPAIRWRPHVAGLIRFVPFFILQSIVGGVDVARRAFHPRLPLSPGFIDYPLALPAAAPRLVFAGTVSLLPGTLSVEFIEGREAGAGGPHLRVHLLDIDAPAHRKLRDLEVRVADLFDVQLHGRG